jgi:hypothetical protein
MRRQGARRPGAVAAAGVAAATVGLIGSPSAGAQDECLSVNGVSIVDRGSFCSSGDSGLFVAGAAFNSQALAFGFKGVTGAAAAVTNSVANAEALDQSSVVAAGAANGSGASAVAGSGGDHNRAQAAATNGGGAQSVAILGSRNATLAVAHDDSFAFARGSEGNDNVAVSFAAHGSGGSAMDPVSAFAGEGDNNTAVAVADQGTRERVSYGRQRHRDRRRDPRCVNGGGGERLRRARARGGTGQHCGDDGREAVLQRGPGVGGALERRRVLRDPRRLTQPRRR